MSTGGGHRHACAACKHQRKKCEDCVLAPYFPPNRNEDFLAVYKVFGLSNVTKMVQNLPEWHREHAVDGLVWEARLWKQNPVHGPFGHYRKLENKFKLLQEQFQQHLTETGYNTQWNGNVSSHDRNGEGGISNYIIEEGNLVFGSSSSSSSTVNYNLPIPSGVQEYQERNIIHGIDDFISPYHHHQAYNCSFSQGRSDGSHQAMLVNNYNPLGAPSMQGIVSHGRDHAEVHLQPQWRNISNQNYNFQDQLTFDQVMDT